MPHVYKITEIGTDNEKIATDIASVSKETGIKSYTLRYHFKTKTRKIFNDKYLIEKISTL